MVFVIIVSVSVIVITTISIIPNNYFYVGSSNLNKFYGFVATLVIVFIFYFILNILYIIYYVVKRYYTLLVYFCVHLWMAVAS